MPTPTFFRLPDAKRARLVEEAVLEFAERSYAEASLSAIARRTGIAKGSFYQYFADKLDLYRWLIADETPRLKRAFVGEVVREGSADAGAFWVSLERFVERGMAFLVVHPRLARLSAAAADPSADVGVRGLHAAICEAGIAELRALLDVGVQRGAIDPRADLDVCARFVSTVIGPGLTDVILRELGAELHEVLGSDALRARLDGRRRARLAAQAVGFIRGGLAPTSRGPAPTTKKNTTKKNIATKVAGRASAKTKR